MLIIIANLGSGAVSFFMRRDFARGLGKRHEELRVLLPDRVARFVSIAQRDEDGLYEAFRPESRFGACLSSDWRNYQAMTEGMTPAAVSTLFRRYYTVLFEELDRVDPAGNYNADWVADEVMITFFGEADDRRRPVENALRMAVVMAGAMKQRIHREIDVPLAYDIGLSCGIGHIGLQGPRGRLKSTMTGGVPGIAKRLESEAKELRAQAGVDYHATIVAMDVGVAAVARELPEFRDLTPFRATGKNVGGQTFFQCQLSVRPESLPESA